MSRVKSLANQLSKTRAGFVGRTVSRVLALPLAFSFVVATLTPVVMPELTLAQSDAQLSEPDAPVASAPAVGAPAAGAPLVSSPVAGAPVVGKKAPAGKSAQSFSPFSVLPLPTAVQFPVVFDTAIDSRTAREGNLVECHLIEDLVFENHLVAPAGSIVLAHIDHYVRSRTMTQAMASKDERFHKTSIVKLSFDEIITPEQEHIKIEGILSRQKAIVGTKVERQIVVDKKGVVDTAEPTLSDDTMVGAQVVNFTVGTGLSSLGTVATFGVLPIVMGVIGAANPSIITMKAVSKDDLHPRMRGMTMGVVSALPGGNVLQSFIYRGSELNIKIGDQLLVQAHSPYNNQTSTSEVSAKLVVNGTSDGQPIPQHFYPKYQPKFIPKAGNKVLGSQTGTEDRFGLWQ